MFPIECLLYAVCSWLIVLVITGYVGLGTIIAGMTLAGSSFYYTEFSEYIYFAFAMACFILFTHRSNVGRMLRGDENQFKKIMLFKKIFG